MLASQQVHRHSGGFRMVFGSATARGLSQQVATASRSASSQNTIGRIGQTRLHLLTHTLFFFFCEDEGRFVCGPASKMTEHMEAMDISVRSLAFLIVPFFFFFFFSFSS